MFCFELFTELNKHGTNGNAGFAYKKLIARRIVCDVKEGDAISQGEKFGMIRFGSKVDLYFENYKLLVRKGQNTVAGETLLAIKK